MERHCLLGYCIYFIYFCGLFYKIYSKWEKITEIAYTKELPFHRTALFLVIVYSEKSSVTAPLEAQETLCAYFPSTPLLYSGGATQSLRRSSSSSSVTSSMEI